MVVDGAGWGRARLKGAVDCFGGRLPSWLERGRLPRIGRLRGEGERAAAPNAVVAAGGPRTNPPTLKGTSHGWGESEGPSES